MLVVVDALAGAAEEDAASGVEDIAVTAGVDDGIEVTTASVPVDDPVVADASVAAAVVVVNAPPPGASVRGKNRLAR